MMQERLFQRLSALLALLAAILAGVGLYGLMSYAVARRTREFGIRMALGARQSNIVAAVTGEALAFGMAGSIFGWFGGNALANMLRNMLFGVTPLDMWVYFTTAAVFVIIACLSTLVPARKAARVQPATALRTE